MGTIIITSKKDGFRRGGIAHSKEPTEYPADHFGPEVLKQLQAEPMLTVQLGEAETKPPKVPEEKPPKAEDLIAAVEAAQTLEQLAALVPDTEKRKTVIAAFEKRIDELQPKE